MTPPHALVDGWAAHSAQQGNRFWAYNSTARVLDRMCPTPKRACHACIGSEVLIKSGGMCFVAVCGPPYSSHFTISPSTPRFGLRKALLLALETFSSRNPSAIRT